MLIDQWVPKTVSKTLQAKYGPVIGNWTYLSNYLQRADPSANTIGIMMRMELNGRRRKDILIRLGQRLSTAVRKQLQVEFDTLWSANDDDPYT